MAMLLSRGEPSWRVLSRVGTAIRTGRRSLRSFYDRHSFNINVSVALTLFLLVSFWPWIFVTIPAGRVGVKWYRFSGGTDVNTVFGEGGHFLLPWDKMAIYDARVQQVSRDYDVLSRDGLMMTVNAAFRFRLNEATVGLLHKHIGAEYVDTVLAPAVGSYARIVFSQNSTDSIYTDRRAEIQEEVKQAVADDLIRNFSLPGRQGTPWLFLEDVLIRSMRFPPEVQGAINRKMAQYQLRQEYTYRLQREELESQRKEIEARGIARFQSIVGAGISETYLRWKGIDATLALAQSPNAKTVVIGTGREGMPLILGTGDAPAPRTPPSATPLSNTPDDAAGGPASSASLPRKEDAHADPVPDGADRQESTVSEPDVPSGKVSPSAIREAEPSQAFTGNSVPAGMVDILRRVTRLGRPEAPARQEAPDPAAAASSGSGAASAESK